MKRVCTHFLGVFVADRLILIDAHEKSLHPLFRWYLRHLTTFAAVLERASQRAKLFFSLHQQSHYIPIILIISMYYLICLILDSRVKQPRIAGSMEKEVRTHQLLRRRRASSELLIWWRWGAELLAEFSL
jgi:hypothetical protein